MSDSHLRQQPDSGGSHGDSDPPDAPARSEPEAQPEAQPEAEATGEPPRAGGDGVVEPVPPNSSVPGKTRRLANLLPGGNASVVAARERKRAREAPRPTIRTREDVLAVLREIVGDPDESGSYRTAAARLLLTPDGAPQGTCAFCRERPCECFHCRFGRAPKDVKEWIESIGSDDGDDKPQGGNGKCT